jgi:hypothetical protein
MDSGATEQVIERQIIGFVTTSKCGMTALQVGAKFQWSVGVASELLQVLDPLLLFLLISPAFVGVVQD